MKPLEPEPNTSESPEALAGLRILDLTRRMGSYCGLLLANLGAEVVLIEPPEGVSTRREGPFENESRHPAESITFAAYHTNKRGIVLDLESGNDRETLRDLARHADALIEDLPAGALERFDLGYSDLRSINPALVMTSVSGFGRLGPYRDFKAPNIVAFAMGGLMNLCGHPGRAPLTAPSDIPHRLGSLHAAYGTLVALLERRVSGEGDHVDVSLQDVLAADPFLRIITRYSVTAEVPARTGHSQTTTVADTYRCRDGYARIFCNQADHWRRLIEWLGNPPELMDPKFEAVQNRHSLRPLLDRLIEARTLNYDVGQFFDEFQNRRLAAAPINSPSAFLNDPQTRHRGYVVDVAGRKRRRFPGDPYKFSESPWRIKHGAPRLGEHQPMLQDWLQPSPWLDSLGRSGCVSRAFAGIRVVSFPTGIVGPALGCLLAEHGAEVISVEAGRAMRSPQRGERFQVASDLESNRNRKRVAINMKHPEGAALAKRLIAVSDVVVENFSARVMASWGLDYPRVRQVREDIIMASLQAFGQTGPRRDYVSFGPILMAYSGMTYLWRDPDIERPGAACQTAFPDYVAPSYGALAILAALHYRARTGKGQYIDVSQAETAASMIAPAHLEWLTNGREPQPQGNFSASAAPHGCYKCKGDDRWCVIAVESEEEWACFCEVTGHNDWRADARFANFSARVENRRMLDALVDEWTAQHTPHQVMMILQRHGIAAGVVQTAEDLYRDPHLRERASVREVFHPEVGWVTRAGPSVRLSRRKPALKEEAHFAGDDNEAICGELLGMSSEEITDLVEQGVLR